MNTQDYFSISEVAELFNISRQAVYKKVDKEFKPYLTMVDNKKMLSKKILELKEDKTDNQVDSFLSTWLSESLQLLKEQNELLAKELEIKNLQIKDQSEIIKEQTKTITEMNHSLSREQVLHAGTIQNSLESNKNEEKDNKLIIKSRGKFWNKLFK